MALRVSSPTFVGRERELERVSAALDQAGKGQPAAFLVAGEAGVGKTRFVHEIAMRASRADFRLLEGGCVQVGSEGLPFGPFIEALRGLTHQVPAGELEALLGAGRADLVRLMPQLLRPGETEQQVDDDPSRQSRLFEHFLLLLERLAAKALLLLVVEDLHWADRSTLALLGFVIRNLRWRPIVLVATYRSDELHRRHPLLPFLAEQERAGRAQRIELPRFEWPELAAQLRGILDKDPDADLVERIMARSQGNAFYAEELLAGGDRAGRLPDTLRDVLLARVATLGPPTQEFVRFAAAGGGRVSLALIATVMGTDQRNLEPALHEAIAQHVLVPLEGSAREDHGFRHALLQEAVYDELLPGERTRLHGAFARALADAAGPEPDPGLAAQLAYHWQAAHDLPRAFDAWLAAGIGAERLYAFAEAAAYYDRTLELWDKVPDADARAPMDHAQVLTRAALHARGTGPARSVELIRNAIALVDPAVDPARAGLLYEALGHNLGLVGDIAGSMAAYEEGVRLVPPEPPSSARAHVLAGLGTHLVFARRFADSAAVCAEAVSVAATAGVPSVWAMIPLGADLVFLGDVETGLATLRQARHTAEARGNAYEVVRAMGWLVRGLLEAGRNEDAAEAAAEAETWAAGHGLGALWGRNDALGRSEALIPLGRWDEAEDAIASAQQYRTSFAEAWMEVQSALLEAVRGQFESAGSRLARLPTIPGGAYDEYFFLAPAEFALWRGDPAAAREPLAAAMTRRPGETQVVVRKFSLASVLAIRVEADLAASARARRAESDVQEARTRGAGILHKMQALVEEVRAQRPYYVPMATASLALCEAEFARLEARSEPDAWAAAAARFEGQPFVRAYALMREGEAALAGPHDRTRAEAVLDEARAVAIRVGAKPMLRLIESLATAARGSRPGQVGNEAPRGRYDLTPREREVLQLLVGGRSDGEIADALFISKKTVSVHLANIKGKLAARSRVEIVTSAMAMGLVSGPSTGVRSE